LKQQSIPYLISIRRRRQRADFSFNRLSMNMLTTRTISILFCCLLTAADGAECADPYGGWAYYGGTQNGIRYSSLGQINRRNVEDLEVAWVYHTGEMDRRGPDLTTNSSTQNTPTLVAGSLMICTPFNRLIALDPATGKERWVFDAQIDLDHALPFQYNCRGVTGWENPAADKNSDCQHRVFMGTNDERLLAVDANTGKRCKGFGSNGEISVTQRRPLQFSGERKLSSAPVVVNGVIAIGSFVMDNLRTDAPLGTVFAYDAVTGDELWQFDPIPRHANDPAYSSWFDGSALKTGAANVWTTMVADPERDLIFAPVGSASPDFWGGERKGDNLYSSSIVALSASTGKVVWHFQHVHHDIWDYDTPSPPMLIDIKHDGKQIPVVVQNTKQGFSFVLHRETGEPVFGVEERPVPQNALAGEWLSPTQPVPVKPPPLVPSKLTADDAWGFTYFDRKACREKIESLRFEGMFTPPSTAPGSIIYPGTAGGMNWGGPAYDPARKWMIVNTVNVPQVVIMVPREQIEGVVGISLEAGIDVAAALGTPYGVRREWLLSPLGAPCVKPPWGELLAVDMEKGSIEWRVPLGSIEKMLPLPIEWNLGTPNLGGPIVTAGGLIFIGATMDGYLRAFDIDSGEELWKDELPGGTQTTPMTYSAGGKQYVVMVSGHHLWFGSPASDAVVAYSLPGQGGRSD
jgi:quinoprotein glucose dehydrogenase